MQSHISKRFLIEILERHSTDILVKTTILNPRIIGELTRLNSKCALCKTAHIKQQFAFFSHSHLWASHFHSPLHLSNNYTLHCKTSRMQRTCTTQTPEIPSLLAPLIRQKIFFPLCTILEINFYTLIEFPNRTAADSKPQRIGEQSSVFSKVSANFLCISLFLNKLTCSMTQKIWGLLNVSVRLVSKS